MTHDPCRYNCCIPPSAQEAADRARKGLDRRKRDLLEDIREATAWDRPLIVPYTHRDALAELISDGLVIETAAGPRPHPV